MKSAKLEHGVTIGWYVVLFYVGATHVDSQMFHSLEGALTALEIWMTP